MSTGYYPPIADYAYIADCHCAALVGKSGSIDWCCMPRIDSPSCFGRLIDWQRAGYCRIAPVAAHRVSRCYLGHSLIPQTSFHTEDGGKANLIDCFTMREGGAHRPYRQILRILEGVKGSVDFQVDIVVRFDYGSVKPWIRRLDHDHFIAIGGNHGLLISGDVGCVMQHRHDLQGKCTIEAGQRKYLSIIYRRSEELDEGLVQVPAINELGQRLDETRQWWSRWAKKADITDHYADYAEYIWRSAIVLKGLTYAPTGAIAAAATTSLPETPGGSRNWDYRYSWIRDSCFSVRSLAELGFDGESEGFRRFVERSSAGNADELQILFGVGGERRLTEINLDEMEGYGGARPVRIGNGAEMQRQLDVYGELLDLAWRWYTLGHSPDDDYWEFITELVNSAARFWDKPDRGIWEIRGKPRHFVLSKVMCWAACDYGIRLAEDLGRKAPLDHWQKVRGEIRRAIEDKGYDADQGVFIQAFGHKNMDAALLLLPTVGFVDYRDDRMLRTTDAVWRDLGENGFLRRYAPDDDELAGEEGAFLACSFWLVECLAYQGRLDQAHEVFRQAIKAGNDLYLFSEEYHTKSHRMLGNFPQGLTHLSLITAAVALAAAEKEED